jgi:hypothetical protein
MATEALLIILALIGIGIIVVVTMLLLQEQMRRDQREQRPVEKVIIREEERPYFRWWDRSYSHVPVRPVIYG